MPNRRMFLRSAAAAPVLGVAIGNSDAAVTASSEVRNDASKSAVMTAVTKVLQDDDINVVDRVGRKPRTTLLGDKHPNLPSKWQDAKTRLSRALHQLAPGDHILEWLRTFDSSFDSLAASIVVNAGKALATAINGAPGSVNSVLPYETQLFDTLLRSASSLLDRCLTYRREMGSFEISGVKAGFDYLTFLSTTPIQRKLLILADHTNEANVAASAQQNAADAFRYNTQTGFAFQASGEARQAELTEQKEPVRTKLAQRQFEINVEAQLSQFTRYLSPGSASNYAERYLRVRKLLDEDLSDAYTKLFCASHGLPTVLGLQKLRLSSGALIPTNIPLFSHDGDTTGAIPTWVDTIIEGRGSIRAPDILDALVLWTRAALRTIEQMSQYETEITVSIPLTQPSGSQTTPLISEAAVIAAFGPGASSHQINFTLASGMLPFSTPLKNARLAGVGLTVVAVQDTDIPVEYNAGFPYPAIGQSESAVLTGRTTVADTYVVPKLARLNAVLSTPMQKSDMSTPYQRPPLLLPNVRVQGGYSGDSEPPLYSPAACRNIDPFSAAWTLALDSNSVLWFNGNLKSDWIRGFILHFALRGTVG